MKKKITGKKRSARRENLRTLLIAMVLPGLILAALFITRASFAGSEEETSRGKLISPLNDPNIPTHIDARINILSRTETRELEKTQTKAILSLQNRLGGEENLKIIYNGLTTTPSRISNPNGYLTNPSTEPAETIARNFIRQYSEMFRFDENDLNNLTLRSRAVTQEGTTILLFQQQINGVPVYQGEVLVNVSKSGQIINVGGMNYPRMTLANSEAGISAAQAVAYAADSMKISNYYPQSLGEAKILNSFGDLKPIYAEGEKFSGGGVFTGDISVQKVVFPLGAEGRLAYKFVVITPQYYGIMWQNIVDAQTGEILQRLSLTAFQNEPGGGTGSNRRGSFRPDVQNMVESYFHPGGASGKVFDTYPATLSGVGGVGRATRTGTPGSYVYSKPTYDSEASDTNRFRFSIINARNESPLFFNGTGTQTFTEAMFPSVLGQVVRGLPDATFPTSSSPFGWFYLPTGTGGAEITVGDANRAATRVSGYTISSEAQTRNLPVNSPTGNGSQPFSTDTTPLGASTTLTDGRVLNSAIQSRYTEGNNVSVSDDRENDDNSTRGIKGYSPNRQFLDSRFDYYSSYELGGVNASGGGTGGGTVTYPASANPDVYPGAVSLFYFNNVEHDYLYSIGFTEALWNFQFDNFGKGGAGADGIFAEVQDGSGTDNANMGTPDDGSSPRMQMYLFTDGGFRRSDGDFDWDVIAHEQYHGVSNRSAGKGLTSCLGTPLVGESGGMGEGWGDFLASSLADDDSEGEHVTGDQDRGIRRLPHTNYRYSYGAMNNQSLNVRKNANTDVIGPDGNPGGIPFQVHDIGELWSATLWDMRELLIVKQKVGNTFPGIFFDGTRRMGGGANFYIGERLVQSVDANHPINYRQGFGTDDGTTTPFPAPVQPKINSTDIVRPGVLATENSSGMYPKRQGPLATAVANGGRLADKITLRGLQLTPCNPSFVDMRTAMIAADREITGGENVAIIWRAFTSHGVGTNATSPNSGTGGAGAVVEDFTLPANISACELSGPLNAPTYSLSNTTANTVTVTITPLAGAADYVIQRSNSANGPFTTIATQAGTTFQDTTGISVGNTYYYQVHARRNTDCVGTGNTQNITVTVGTAPIVSPIFFGADSVSDPKAGNILTVNWSAATSANPNAVIVYDVYRVINVALDNDLTAPTFTPSAGNRIAQNLTGTTFTDTNLTTGQQYYYIVRARDTNNNQTDTNNTGNTRARFNAPTTTNPASQAFALEDFSQSSANNRFTPALVDSATPDVSTPVFQRVPNAVLSLVTSDAMYAPNFDPGNSGQGGPSNFSTAIGPLTLTRGSILEFDHRFSTEAGFDGNNLEIVLGTPTANPQDATPFPNNSTTFELNDYLIQGGYNGALDARLEGAAIGSPLQGRRSFTGTNGLSHVRAALGDFAPGGVRNPNSLPVYVRFHTSSDVGTNAGAGSGWYVDNLVVNNFTAVVNVSISGTITKNGSPLAGVSVALSGNSSATTTTNASGQYTFGNLTSGGNYLITPTLSGNTFEPNNRSYTSVSANISNADFVAYDSTNFPRTLTVVNSFATPGQPVTVPISLVSLGDEAGFSFSLSYNSALLSNPQVACGSDAAGCVITTNPTSGAIGIVIDNVAIAAGTRQIATVTFATTANPPNTASNTPVGFVNSPTPRSVSNDNGDSLSASYIDGLVVFAQNLECDVAGRFTGDNDVLSNDITIMRQFVARNITPNGQYNEFQRADCAPRGTSGDAQILSNDLLQTRRYAARNDALQQAAGPNQEAGSFTEQTLQVKETNVFEAVAANPLVRVVSKDSSPGATVIVPLEIDVSSDVIALSLSVEFDRTKLTYQSAALGSGVPAGSVLTLNTNKINDSPTGKLGIVVDSGNSFAMGTRQLVTLTFTVASNAPTGLTPVIISGDPTPKSTSDSQGNLVMTNYADGNVNILPPTAATVSVGGRIMNNNGNGVANALVRLIDTNGNARVVRSSSFGYYRFDEVEVGETYVIDVVSKRYTFLSRTVAVSEELSNVDFTAEPSQ